MAVDVERRGKVWTVILNRPEVRNAVDGPTARALADAFREFDGDDSACVAVLCGAGGTFCAGADLKAIARGENANAVSEEGDGPMGPTRMVLGKPVIAAVSGYAVAGGFELALWCDLRIVERGAVLGCFERRWGVPLIDGGTIRLPRLIGLSRAMDLLLTGRPVQAGEALEIGLANLVVENGTARAEAERLAGQIAEFPQVCLRNDRLSALEQYGMDTSSAIRNELRRGIGTLESGETVEGSRRFGGGAGRHGAF